MPGLVQRSLLRKSATRRPALTTTAVVRVSCGRRTPRRVSLCPNDTEGFQTVLSTYPPISDNVAMSSPPNYRGYRFPPEIISHTVWLYHRFTLSLRDIEDLLAERNVIVS